jgi:uncharacterized membrane protein YkoI
MRLLPLIAAVTLSAALLPSAANADDERDHDRARRAVEAGEVMPLNRILDTLEREHPGQVIEVELEQEDGHWIYEIKLLRPGGSLVKMEVDARDGAVLKSRERGSDKDGAR